MSESESTSPEGQPQDKTGESNCETTAVSGYPPLTTRYSLLISYFRSGWAFLIPYLAAYLLYAWLKWPVNPEGAVKAIGEISGTVSSQLSTLSSQQSPFLRPPCLLHVYWTLHAMHLVLGAIALRTWWRESGATVNGETDNSPETANRATPPQPSTVPLRGNRSLSTVYGLLPWLGLALIFLLPGYQWEFPSDPWEHYLRINHWNLFTDIRSNSVWPKASYFLTYTLVANQPATRQLTWLHYYTVATSLLLCWQYYYLSREIGLKAKPAFIFVLIQTLFFGNNLFSYYRYYSIGSTILAQIAAIAMIRLGLYLTKPSQCSVRSYWVSNMISIICLGLLMTFNHIQSLGVAFLGLLSVVIWRMESWKRGSGWGLLSVLFLSSIATVKWWPLSPMVRESFKLSGWLTPWYSFNIFTPGSPASTKMIQILGGFGLLNLIAGLLLLRKNHPAGWLTILPLLALSIPAFAVPLAEALAHRPLSDVDIFHRMFFSIPAGLAIVALATNWFRGAVRTEAHSTKISWSLFFSLRLSPFIICLLLLTALTTAPASSWFFNRFWHTLARTPDDLAMNHLIDSYSELDSVAFKSEQAGLFVTTQGAGFIATASGMRFVSFNERLLSTSRRGTIAATNDRIHGFILGEPHERNLVLFVPATKALFTATSQAGYMSGHWIPQEVALEHAADKESSLLGKHLKILATGDTGGTYYFIEPRDPE